MFTGSLSRLIGVGVVLMSCGVAMAQDWNTVPLITHSTYQAVQAGGASAYAGGFPIRLRGVVLNNTEDWLDPTPNYTGSYVPFAMGGQAEMIVQSVDLADRAGTFAWIGQNYGNLPFKGDPIYNYTNTEWTSELARLNFLGGTGVTTPVRKGDLVEIRARGGLFYGGKQNVNEQHDKSTAKDFEVVVLQSNYGLPDPIELTLADLKDASNVAIFDPTRQTGGERYQAMLVELNNVRLTAASIANWGINKDLTLEDDTGRTLGIHLGYNSSFGGTAPQGYFDVVGILDQNDGAGVGGYRLLAMNAGDFAAVPEPGALGVVALAMLALRRRRKA